MKHIKIELPEIIVGIQKVDCIHLEGEWLVFENHTVFLNVCEHLYNTVSELSFAFDYTNDLRVKPVTPHLRRRGCKKLYFTEGVNEFLLVRGEVKVYTTFDSEEDMYA